MKRCLVLLAMFGCQAWAQSGWLTITGNPKDANVDTVQVDPVAAQVDGRQKTMHVRVSRATERRNWDRQPYRSYQSRVVFDCQVRKASYVQATFFPMPLWQGSPSSTNDYSARPQPMLFRDVEPNPTQRLIRAACRSGNAA